MPTEINLTPTASTFEFTVHGQSINGRTWGTAADCHASALLVHGLSAHSGWFETLGRRLKVHGIYAMAYDQIGFGKRQNQKFLSYQQWIDDLVEVHSYLVQQTGDKPIYLMGNSMGGLIAFFASHLINPASLILFSPGFDGHPDAFSNSFRIKAILKAIFQPDEEVQLPHNTNFIAREETIRNFIDSDPDGRFKVPARMLLELIKLSKKVSGQCNQVTVPTLMLTAGYEHVVNNLVNEKVFKKIASKSKQHLQFPEAYHDLIVDPVINHITDTVIQWITKCQDEQIMTV